MKILCQDLCFGKGNWDKRLEGEDLGEWKLFINGFKALKIILVPDVMPGIQRQSHPYVLTKFISLRCFRKGLSSSCLLEN